MSRLLTALLAAALLAGCASLGGPACAGSTLVGEWTEPGLYDALAATGAATHEPAPGAPLPNASFAARWGPVGLVEVAHGFGRLSEATLGHDPYASDGPLFLGISVATPGTLEDGLALAEALLARLGVGGAERVRYGDELRAAWQPAPEGVANGWSRTPFTSSVAWDDAPAALFPNGTPEAEAHGRSRMMRDDGWRLVVQAGALVLNDGTLALRVAMDDHARLNVDLAEGEARGVGFARLNATLARHGIAPPRLEGWSGGQMTC